MSVKLRFRRMGRKQHPVFGLVATDARSPRDGRFIEDLGRYEPIAEPARVKFNADRILYWLGQGAQPSDTVRNLLQKEGILMRWSMTRAGASAEEIETAVEEFKARRAEKAASTGKKTRAERRAEALEAEKAAAKERAAELAKARAEREAELQAQREAAEAEERAAAEAARAEAAAAAADSEALTEAADTATPAAEETAAEAAPDETPEAAEEAVAEATPEVVAEDAPDAAEEQPAVEAETPEAVADEAGEEVADQTDAAAAEEAPAAAEAPAAEEAPAVEADKLTTVNGIGPKYSEILANAGITTFATLAETTVERLQEIITEAGSTTAGNEETWPTQAGFLAKGDTEGFDAYVESLKA